jgi:hypothetical protein
MSHVKDKSRKILIFLCGRNLSRHVLFSPKLGFIYVLFTYNFFNTASGPGEKITKHDLNVSVCRMIFNKN